MTLLVTKINKNMVFLLETDRRLPEAQAESIHKQWDEIFPDNKLVIMLKGELSILEVEK